MVNSRACLCILSTTILILFIVFIYLMTIVNPDPIPNPDPIANPPTPIKPPEIPPDPVDPDMRKLGKDNNRPITALFPVPEFRATYGLEKASATDNTKDGIDASKIIPMYRHLSANGLVVINSSKAQKVVPPTITPPAVSKRIEVAMTMSTPPARGVRRSVNNMYGASRIIEPSSGIILKIVDDLGNPRIEIKLEPHKDFKENREYYTKTANSNSTYIESDSEQHINDIDDEKRTFIKILQNNTVIIDEPDDIISLHKNYFKNSSKVKNEINSNNYEEITLMIGGTKHKNYTMEETRKLLSNNTKKLHVGKILTNKTNLRDLVVNSTKIISNSTSYKVKVLSNIAQVNVTDKPIHGLSTDLPKILFI